VNLDTLPQSRSEILLNSLQQSNPIFCIPLSCLVCGGANTVKFRPLTPLRVKVWSCQVQRTCWPRNVVKTKIKRPDIALCCFYLATRLQTIQQNGAGKSNGKKTYEKVSSQSNFAILNILWPAQFPGLTAKFFYLLGAFWSRRQGFSPALHQSTES
jgi:hypothetical protein